MNIFELGFLLLIVGGGWIVGYQAGGALGGWIGAVSSGALLFLLLTSTSSKSSPVPAARKRAFQGIALLVVLSWAYFPARFTYQFELFGLAVRDNAHGWLGPTPRRSSCVRDIGKVNYWECPDISVFERHRIGCEIWLKLNGFESGA